MPSLPANYRYLETHEWHRLDGDIVTIGITQIAADELTDVTFVALPKVGTKIDANHKFGEIDSVKANSDLYTGVGGTVTETNHQLADNPGLVNNDPYEAGWMIKLQVTDPNALKSLLTSEQYQAKTGH